MDGKSAIVKVTIDRFEEGFAVLQTYVDNVLEFSLPTILLPEGCKEGDVLDLCICLDEAATEEARREIARLKKSLKKNKI